MGERWTTVALLDERTAVLLGEGCTAGRDRSGLLGKRGLCCWLGKGGLLGGEAVLIGGREVDF